MNIIYLCKVFIELLPALGLGRIHFWQHMATLLSAPIHNNGYILAVIFCPTRTLGVEWIRSLISFFDRIYRIDGIFLPAARYFGPEALLSR